MEKKTTKKPKRIRATERVTTPSGDSFTLAVTCEPITKEATNA